MTRLRTAAMVPWAKEEGICTGLWAPGGKIVRAKASFLNSLPPIPLIGYLTSREFMIVGAVPIRGIRLSIWPEALAFPKYSKEDADYVIATSPINVAAYSRRMPVQAASNLLWLEPRISFDERFYIAPARIRPVKPEKGIACRPFDPWPNWGV